MDTELLKKVTEEYRELTELLLAAWVSISIMESCTGGLISSLITDTEGASEIMKGSYVTYSNEAKIREGVPASVIETYGVYSEETAREMAKACSLAYGSFVGIGVTGSLGRKDPENPDSVPGEVFLAIKAGDEIRSYAITIETASSRLSAKLQIAHVLCLMLRRVLLSAPLS